MKTDFKFACLLSASLLLPLLTIRGQVGNNNPTGPSGEFNGEVTTAGSYDPFTGNAKRIITDLVVPGAVGKYGLSYSRWWNSRNGLNNGWSNTFSWSVDYVYRPITQPMHYTVRFPDGRVETFVTPYPPNYSGPAGAPERFQPAGSLAYLLLPDGGKIEFGVQTNVYPGNPNDGTPTYYEYFFTTNAIIDPYGQRISYSHNPDGSISQVTEPAGRYIQFFYAGGQLDHIVSSDGRRVDYTYTTQTFPPGTTPYTVLTSVKYFNDPTLIARYTYDKPNVGSANGAPLLKTCDDLMYAGPMKKISYTYATGNNLDGGAAVWGQIRSEDNATTGQFLSKLDIYFQTRTETRADTKTRTFTYDLNGFLTSATDFKGVAQTQTYGSNLFVNAITDRNGHTTNYTNSSVNGRVLQMQYPSTPGDTPPNTPRGTVNYIYGYATCPDPNNSDANNPYYLYQVVDESGSGTTYTRDTSKRVIRVDYPDGGYETFAYNSFGQVTSHRLKTGGTESWEYDPANNQRLVKYRDPDHASGNPTASYQYDTRGRVSGITDALGSTTTFTYNERGQLLTTTCPPDGYGQATTTFTKVYNPDGTLASVTDQLGHTTSYTYDDYRRVKSITTPQRFTGDTTPRVTNFSYDASQGTADDYTHTDSNVTRLTLPSGNIVEMHYDENYRKDWVQASAVDGTTDAAKTSFEYDNVGNLRFLTAPNQQPNGPKTTYNYDERSRPMSIVDALNNSTSFTYDAAGRKKTITRPNGQVITYDSYDVMNRLLQQTVKQTPDPDAVTKYTYYASDLLNTMQDPRLVANNSAYKYTYVYDQMGRKTSLTYPPDSNNAQLTEAWHYDTAGRIDTFTNRDGKIQTFVYDALNRQHSFGWNDGLTPSVTFGYDAGSRITSVVDIDPATSAVIATVGRSYYNDNLLQSETQTPNAQPAKTINYTYGPDGNRATVQYPDNNYAFTYNYSGRDQLKTIAPSPSGTPIATYGYDPSGNLASRSLDNSTSSSYGYDALNRAISISHGFVNDPSGPHTFLHSYDSVGNRLWSKREGNVGDVFGYDMNDQVTATKLNVANPDTIPVGTQTINYDANGNRTSFAAYGPVDTYTTNNLNQYTLRNSTPATYDTKGNLTTFGAASYQYDAQNRLVSAANGGTTETFKYDGLNRQVSRTVGGVTTYNVWDGWNLIEEIQGGAVINAYVGGAGGMIKNLFTNQYFYQDGSGSTSQVANGTGQLQQWYRYDLHGTPSGYDASNNSLPTASYVRFLFTGQQWYSELGLYDLRNRFYSPDLGRFLQPDPIGFAGDPSNIYRYCGNNPVNWSDPSGLQFVAYKNKGFGIVAWGGNSMSPAQYGRDPSISFGPIFGGSTIGSVLGPSFFLGKPFGTFGPHEPSNFNFSRGLSFAPGFDPGVGPIYMRSFVTTISDTPTTAMELMNAIQNNINRFANAPLWGINFSAKQGSTLPIMLGNTYSIDVPGPSSANVIVTNVTSTSFTLSTFEPHPEAGSITFSASNPGPGTLVFQINSMFQSSNSFWQGVSSLSWVVQGGTWTSFSHNVVVYSGGQGTITRTSWGP